MPPSLYLSPSTEASLDHLLSQIESHRRGHPLIPVHILVPTSQAQRALRRRLPEGLGVHLFQFYALAEHVLDQAGLPVARVQADTVRALVGHLLAGMHQAGEMDTFEQVWDKPGFLQVIIRWLREMKTQGIPPEDVETHAAAGASPRDRQLARIYVRYQDYLRSRQLSDADGLLWLASQALEDDPQLARKPGSFFALGFDQFNPIQLRILAALSGRYGDFGIYLLWDPDRLKGSLALARLAETRSALHSRFALQEHTLEEHQPVEPVLAHLRRWLFEPTAAKITPKGPIPVTSVAAPSREAEVRWALRAVKRLLLDSTPIDEIALLAPNPEAYRGIVRAVASEYGLPLLSQENLADNPAITALANALRLAPDFPWRGTLEALRSPYIQQPWFNTEQIDLLDQLSRERPVIAGREQWRFALQPLELPQVDPEDEDLGPPPLVSRLPPEDLAAIEAGFLAFCDAVTPPENATPLEYGLWIQSTLLGMEAGPEPGEMEPQTEPIPSLNMAAACREDPAHARRDRNALSMLLQILHRQVFSARVLPTGNRALPWETFRDELLNQLSQTIPTDPTRPALRFGPLEAARDTSVDHLFVLGLGEGEFPQPPPPDPLYAPAERRDHPLPLQRYSPADDASLWWQVVGNCRRHLYLLRPRLDENGAPWLPSPYWEALVDLVDGLVEIELPIAALPSLEQACSPSELLTGLATSQAQRVPAELEPIWSAARAAQSVARQRGSWDPPGAFEGGLASPGLQAELARRYGPEHGWSVSRLNRYGNCPYGFFAESVLQLEPRPDPEEGLDPLQRGSLLHALLERLYGDLAETGLDLVPEEQDAILEHLDRVCREHFPSAPQRYGFRPSALWHHEQVELRRLVENLVVWECGENGAAARFHPYRQELRFGIPGAQLPKLQLQAPSGTAFLIHGVIDRLDRDQDGDLRVIDYKSGATGFSKTDIRLGAALQTALYALAAERLTPGRVTESYYLHIPSRKASGHLKFADGVEADETVQVALGAAAGFVDRVREGFFPSAPAKSSVGARACRDRCDFAALCRVTRRSIAKARRSG
jgi:ATP-dependent helicase/DNAse subunit B